MKTRPPLSKGAICRWSKKAPVSHLSRRTRTLIVVEDPKGDSAERSTWLRVMVINKDGRVLSKDKSVKRDRLWFTGVYGKLPSEQGKSLVANKQAGPCVCSINELMNGGCPSNRGLKCKSRR